MICPICNKPFEHKALNQIYCSSGVGSCRAVAARQRLEESRKSKIEMIGSEVPCKRCGALITKTGPYRRFCETCVKKKKSDYAKEWRIKNMPPKTAPVQKKKVVVVAEHRKEILCPWERGDILPVAWGGGMEFFA